ncbi:MAG: FAD-dependent oxidoreductase [Actinobacteria bacterium]|nr:FAD-dependent oxidoreductase [Actinomycetota bacterium]
MTESLDRLLSQARQTRIIVVGGGISGLVAALECAKVGVVVTVLEASDRLGGVLRSADVAGLTLDTGAESFATRGGHVRTLIDELDLGNAVVSPVGGPAWVSGLPGGGAAPMPAGGVLGIPGNAFDPTVRRIIGWSGAWRGYLDRLRPPLTIGHQRSLGELVRTRMGAKILDRLVAPVTTGVYSACPDDIDVDLAAPGLNAALTRTGSLSGAVLQLRGDTTKAPGAAVAGLDGGMTRLVNALHDRLIALGADVRTGAAVAGLEQAEPDAAGESVHRPWRVQLAHGAGDLGADAPDATTPGADILEADAVIVAVSEPEARRLLATAVPSLDQESEPAPVVEVVTLVLEAPALDSAPRGTGVLTVPGSHTAKALTHSTAKWQWVARAAGPGIHVVRVSFGAQGEAPATEALDDADAAALALSEAAALLGVALDVTQLRGAHRERYTQSQPATVRGRPAVVAAARGAVHAVPGLAAVGAWLSGTGLAQVIPDAVHEAERVRRAVLWDGLPSNG